MILANYLSGIAMEEARLHRQTHILMAEEDRSTLPRRQAQPLLPLTVFLMDRHKDRLL